MYSQPIPAINKPKPKHAPSQAAIRPVPACSHNQNRTASEIMTRGNSENGAKPKTAIKPKEKAMISLCAETSFIEGYRLINLANYRASPILLKITLRSCSVSQMRVLPDGYN